MATQTKKAHVNNSDKPDLSYTKRGNIYVKPADIAKSKAGKKLLKTYRDSGVVKSINARESRD